jgi:hypothetical protein
LTVIVCSAAKAGDKANRLTPTARDVAIRMVIAPKTSCVEIIDSKPPRFREGLWTSVCVTKCCQAIGVPGARQAPVSREQSHRLIRPVADHSNERPACAPGRTVAQW